ncbi:XRE family transcriptional regulator [Bremerella cremea]|uniref:XRE family transcriptional regulator n=1 Tax=Bremerella cremea TaxID=1031537 RepID=A0A368KKE7_9BACT|nr:XRE family transcriptional regulator [Bremerella cremea]
MTPKSLHEFRVVKQVKAALERRQLGPPERSLRELERELGISHGNLKRFLDGDRGVSLEAFARICEILELELKPKQGNKRK